MRHILSLGIHCEEALFSRKILFVFPAFTDPPDPVLLPTQFLAPSFHLSGTAIWVTFDWHESHTMLLSND